MTPHCIREARENDAEALAEIILELGWFEWFDPGDEVGISESISRKIAGIRSSPDHSLYVAEAGRGQTVGFGAVHWLPHLLLPGLDGYVTALFIKKEYRGKGMGSALLDSITKEARSRGCFRLTLINGRNSESYRRRFYRGQGWIEREETAIFARFLRF